MRVARTHFTKLVNFHAYTVKLFVNNKIRYPRLFKCRLSITQLYGDHIVLKLFNKGLNINELNI